MEFPSLTHTTKHDIPQARMQRACLLSTDRLLSTKNQLRRWKTKESPSSNWFRRPQPKYRCRFGSVMRRRKKMISNGETIGRRRGNKICLKRREGMKRGLSFLPSLKWLPVKLWDILEAWGHLQLLAIAPSFSLRSEIVTFFVRFRCSTLVICLDKGKRGPGK